MTLTLDAPTRKVIPPLWAITSKHARAEFGIDWWSGDPPEMQVWAVKVEPEHRGQGLGRKLMQKAMRRAKKEGCAAISLFVDPDNTPAVRLYESLGFEHTGEFSYENADHTKAEYMLAQVARCTPRRRKP